MCEWAFYLRDAVGDDAPRIVVVAQTEEEAAVTLVREFGVATACRCKMMAYQPMPEGEGYKGEYRRAFDAWLVEGVTDA